MIKLERPVCPNPSALQDSNYKHRDNKDALRKASYDKCMYCESKIPHVDFAHVEHIKPKAADKFPELEFTWENLGYACAKCNNAKSSKYFNDTPFIDPYVEEPSEFVIFSGPFMFHRNGGERGEISITEIELNRPELIERRMEKIKALQKHWKPVLELRTKH
jgi:uncharacterized protein (TIGR02646 family)